MKKFAKKVVSVVLIFAAVLLLSACKNDNERWATETTTPSNQGDASADVTTITFAIPAFCKINESYLMLFNEELLNDGYKYKLEIEYINYDFTNNEYFKSLEYELNNGSVDVAFLGLGDDSNSIYSLIMSGAVMNLDEVLSSDKGKALYESFPQALWEAVKCNGLIYSIPQANTDDNGIFVAFNTDYIEESAIENWDGSINSIYKIINDINWDDNVAPRFQYLLTDYDFGKMIGCEIRKGLLYDYETKQIENPLKSEKFIGYLQVLELMKNKGYMADSISYYQNTAYIDEEANLSSGKFLVALSSGEPEAYYLKKNITIKKITPILSPRINASIGISSKTANPDAVVDFLGLLYGNEKYGNILLYGKQDLNYKLVDGFAVKIDGSELPYDFMTKISLNLFINIHPVKGEGYTQNRKVEFFSFYKDVNFSPFIGFEADIAGNGAISSNLQKFLISLKEKSLDNAVKEYSAKLKNDGIDECLSSVNKQWDAFNK